MKVVYGIGFALVELEETHKRKQMCGNTMFPLLPTLMQYFS